MKDVLIVTGGKVNISFCKEVLSKGDYTFQQVIGVDKGLESIDGLGIMPNLILGDYDSVDKMLLKKYEEKGVPILAYPPEKDYTDTHLALYEAFQCEPERILILGGTGSRLDHVYANVGLLMLCAKRGIEGIIWDEHNRIRMLSKPYVLKKDEAFGKYVSLIPYTQQVQGIYLTGFQYPLEDATFTLGASVGISNELIGEEGTISFRNGLLIMIESRD